MSRLGGNPIVARRIGGNILRYREAQGLNQNDVALRTGRFSSDQVSKWERGEKLPQLDAFEALAKALGVRPEDLLDPADIADARARAVAAARAGALLRDKRNGTPRSSPRDPQG